MPVGTPVNISATASDPDGNVSQVLFTANGATIATVLGFPYNTTWTPANLGAYTITAKATDNQGNTTTSVLHRG